MNRKFLVFGLYIFLFFVLCIYSYALVDPNFTLINHSLWTSFRNIMVQLGYHNRTLSTTIFFLITLLLFIFHEYFLKKKIKFDALKIGFIIAFILLLSYPFLSHDFFNYMFDAKIFTFYGKNPYVYKALDFPGDQWLRFMHWTHRTYPYGPVFLLLSFIPSFLSFGKLILNFILFKSLFILFYLSSVYILNRMKNSYALLFATHPLIIIEGLVNGHNDMAAVFFAILGIYYITLNKNFFGRFLLLLSAGIKFLTFPFLFITKKGGCSFFSHKIKGDFINKAIFMAFTLSLIWMAFFRDIHSWYFLNYFIFVSLFSNIINDFKLFFIGLLFSYYPYIMLGGWDTPEKVVLKKQIMLAFLIVNLLYIFLKKRESLRFLKKNS